MPEDLGSTRRRPVLGGRYELLQRAGQGACGEVHRARDRELGRVVAVKLYREFAGSQAAGALERFEREARLLAKHPHPAVVPVFDVDLQAEKPYVVLRWMEGGDLAGRIQGAPTATEEVARIGIRLAGALEHLHAHGVYHRDIKPENVLLDEAGEVYLADLGLADALDLEGLTATGMVVGTPRYMAPELFSESLYSEATDLFSLGVVLLELARGERVDFMPGSDLQGTQGELRRVADPALRRVLRGCLRSLPGERVASAAALIARLRGLGREDDDSSEATLAPRPAGTGSGPLPPGEAEERTRSVVVGPGAPPGAPGGSPEPRPLPRVALLGAGLLLLASTGLLLVGRPGDPPPAEAPAAPSPEVERYREAQEALAKVRAEALARKSRFRRERHSADTDSSDLLEADAPRLTDAAVGAMWARYLRRLEAYLLAVEGLPAGAVPLEELAEDFEEYARETGYEFFGDLRRLVLRIGSQVARGQLDPLRASHWLEVSQARVEELREATERWLAAQRGTALEDTPGLLRVEVSLLTQQEHTGLEAELRRLWRAREARPDHQLGWLYLEAIDEVMDQVESAAARGMAGVDCPATASLHERFDAAAAAGHDRTPPAYTALMRAAWRCGDAGDAGRDLVDLATARLEALLDSPEGRRRLGDLCRERREYEPEPADAAAALLGRLDAACRERKR